MTDRQGKNEKRLSAEKLWQEYRAKGGVGSDAPVPAAWHFCFTQPEADECARLVLLGRKRATAPSLWGFAVRGETPPTVGHLEIVTTWSGEACAIIRTTDVIVRAFCDVPAEFARAEGEGDGSLEWWRRAHREYYARELAGTDYSFSDDMPIVCQYFEVVHARPIDRADDR
jgi:uncharacterized protein YhfF